MAKVELHTKAPDFTLDDFSGRQVTLGGYAGQKNILVVFNRGFF